VFVSRLRADKVDMMAVRLGLLSGHYRADRAWTAEVLTEAEARLARWRAAVRQDTGPDAADLIARLRDHLADDLDTPQALRAIDAWADAARSGDGSDRDAPSRVREAVDALLGVLL
jgi:L-cysteine:1D-myo-inositol 2-amino-2-deoxy-alpha-D-glucopyranoside ligase